MESHSGHDDQSFLGKAYVAILGRPADPSDLRDDLGRLHVGLTRAQIIAELASSDEGRRFAAKREGVAALTSLPHPLVSSANELLKLEGLEFVRQAYLSLFGREADPSDLRDYLSRLVSGTSKLQLLAAIHSDPEGQAYGARLPGLEAAIRQGEKSRSVPASIDELLEIEEVAFVHAAYEFILQRSVDPE